MNCGNATHFSTSSGVLTDQLAQDSEQWFEFTPSFPDFRVNVSSISEGKHIHKIELFKGICGSLQLVGIDSVKSNLDTVLSIFSAWNSNSSGYFLKISNTANCSACNSSSISFNLNVTQESFEKDYCGFDRILQQRFASDSNFSSSLSTLRQIASNPVTSTGPLLIPVVIHVMYPAGTPYGTGANISYKQIQWQINQLNAAFARDYNNYNGSSHGPDASPSQIRFCLARIPSPGYSWGFEPMSAGGTEEYGVIRHPVQSSQANLYQPTIGVDDQALFNFTNPNPATFSPSNFLNIWTVQIIYDQSGGTGIQGYGTLPVANNPLDGVVMKSDVFGDNSNPGNYSFYLNFFQQGRLLAHEVGHYLSLYHIFHQQQNDPPCAGMNDNTCQLEGDEICDTPPSIPPAQTVACQNNNTCNETITYNIGFPAFDKDDLDEDYLSYSYDNCLNTFTAQQVQRMQTVLSTNIYRNNLPTTANTTATGVNGTTGCSACLILDANFTANPSQACPGQTVSFTPFYTGSYSGIVSYNWNFGDGSPAVNSSNPTHVFPNTSPMTYTVTLTVTDIYGRTNTISKFYSIDIPEAHLFSYNSGTVCADLPQIIKIEFSKGAAPFQGVLTNGTNSYPFNTNDNSITISVIPTSQPYYVTGFNCNGFAPDQISFSTQHCCPNLLVNGNFETGNLAPSNTSHGYPSANQPFCAGQAPGLFCIGNNFILGSIPASNWNPYPGNLPSRGFSMNLDGRDPNGSYNPAPVNCTAPPCSTKLLLWEQGLNVISGTTYKIDFVSTPGDLNFGPFNVPVNKRLRFIVEVLDNTNTILFSSGSYIVDYATISNWIQHSFTFSSSFTGQVILRISQTGYFEGGGKDFLLDDISVKAVEDPAPSVIAQNSSTTVGCGGGEVKLETIVSGGTSPYNYSWTPGSSLNSTTVSDPLANPVVSTSYTVSVTDANSCVFSASVYVPVVNCCTNCVNTLTSPVASVTPGLSYCVNSNLNITSNVTFSANEIKIGQGFSITVAPGATLTISQSHLHGCSDMWSGILVQPGGKIIINGNSLIEDAIIAIDLSASTIQSPAYALLVDGAVFNRNQTSIKISNYNSPNATAWPYLIRNSVFTSRALVSSTATWGAYPLPNPIVLKTTVSSGTIQQHCAISNNYQSANLKPPFSGIRANTGIRLSGLGSHPPGLYYEITVGDNTINKANLFDNLLFGIDATNSNLKVLNSIFQYILPGGTGKSTTGGVAINAVSTAELYRLSVIPGGQNNSLTNTFYDNARGINCINYHEVYINKTSMRSTQQFSNFQPVNTPPGQLGIFISSNYYRAVDILNNNITNVKFPVTFVASAAPYNGFQQAQFVGPVRINSNTIQANYPNKAITTQFVSTAISATNALNYSMTNTTLGQLGSNIETSNNTLLNVFRGITKSNWQMQVSRSESNYIKMKAEPNDAFNKPTSQYGINHNTSHTDYIYNNNIIGAGNQKPLARGVLCNSNSKELVSCNSVTNAGRGFEFQGVNPVIWQDNSMDNLGNGLYLNSAVIGTQGNVNFASDNVWNGSYPNFKAFTFNCSATNSQMYVQSGTLFYPNSLGGTFPIVGIGMDDYSSNNLFIATPGNRTCPPLPSNGFSNLNVQKEVSKKVIQDSIIQIANNKELRSKSRTDLYNALERDVTFRSSDITLQNFYSESSDSSWAKFIQIEKYLAEKQISLAEGEIASINPTNLVETSYSRYYKSYIHYQEGQFNNVDSVDLELISMGCPNELGSVVYQARALYYGIYSTYKEFSNECENSTSARLMNQSTVTPNLRNAPLDRYKVYPNPNTGKFTLESFDNSENLTIKLSDLRGTILFEQNTNLVSNKIEFNLDFAPGIYLLTIFDISGIPCETLKVTFVK